MKSPSSFALVRGIRITQGISQVAVADALEVDPSTISKYEGGTRGPRKYRVISSVLNALNLKGAVRAKIVVLIFDGELVLPEDANIILRRAHLLREDATLSPDQRTKRLVNPFWKAYKRMMYEEGIEVA